MNSKADNVPTVNTLAISQEANNDLIIVTCTREKRRILEAYKEIFGWGYPDSIVTRKKGKLKNVMSALHSKHMRPCKDKYYQVDVLELHSVIATILKAFCKDLTAHDLCNLHLVCKDFATLIPKITQWMQVNFSTLCKPWYNYEHQE